jgi:hypothetical protein
MSTKQTLILILILIVIIGAILLWGGNKNDVDNPNEIGTTTEDQTGVLEDQSADDVDGAATDDVTGAAEVNGAADASADVDVQSR